MVARGIVQGKIRIVVQSGWFIAIVELWTKNAVARKNRRRAKDKKLLSASVEWQRMTTMLKIMLGCAILFGGMRDIATDWVSKRYSS